MKSRKIKVLIVDDSRSVRDLLSYILNSDPRIEIIGTAENGVKALNLLKSHTPDVITMDMDMPEMNGLEVTRIIMETHPIPIVIVTASWSPSDVNKTFSALDAGAVSVLNKPKGIGHPSHKKMALELIRTVIAMSEVKLVKRWARLKEQGEGLPAKIPEPQEKKTVIKLLAIGASTGGPAAIQKILSALPKNLSVPVLIVQHIAKDFLDGFINWLIISTGHRIHAATHLERVEPGHIYVAPDGFHMGISAVGNIILKSCASENNLCPSVAHLFRSVAEKYGRNAIGILLTGMGKDGARELKFMKDRGAITIAQDEESSVIYGMPGEAFRIGATKYVLPPAEIAGIIVKLLKE